MFDKRLDPVHYLREASVHGVGLVTIADETRDGVLRELESQAERIGRLEDKLQRREKMLRLADDRIDRCMKDRDVLMRALADAVSDVILTERERDDLRALDRNRVHEFNGIAFALKEEIKDLRMKLDSAIDTLEDARQFGVDALLDANADPEYGAQMVYRAIVTLKERQG